MSQPKHGPAKPSQLPRRLFGAFCQRQCFPSWESNMRQHNLPPLLCNAQQTIPPQRQSHESHMSTEAETDLYLHFRFINLSSGLQLFRKSSSLSQMRVTPWSNCGLPRPRLHRLQRNAAHLSTTRPQWLHSLNRLNTDIIRNQILPLMFLATTLSRSYWY